MSAKNRAAASLGKKGGKVGGLSRSPAKIAAARANGAKGGRPSKDAAYIQRLIHAGNLMADTATEHRRLIWREAVNSSQ